MEPTADLLLLGLAWFVVFLFSTTLHEAAHAFIALRLGDPTAYHGGQVTLNPLPHVRREPFGMVLVPILSFVIGGWMFGWASAPYDPQWALRHPRRAAWMALGGPAANLLLVLLAGVAIRIGLLSEIFYPEVQSFSSIVTSVSPGLWSTLATLLSITFVLNLLLFVFNLIPVPPLDGSGAIGLFLSEENAGKLQVVMHQPQFSLLGLLAAWFLIRAIFGPVFGVALSMLYMGVG